jgi:hypothetical protein
MNQEKILELYQTAFDGEDDNFKTFFEHLLKAEIEQNEGLVITDLKVIPHYEEKKCVGVEINYKHDGGEENVVIGEVKK